MSVVKIKDFQIVTSMPSSLLSHLLGDIYEKYDELSAEDKAYVDRITYLDKVRGCVVRSKYRIRFLKYWDMWAKHIYEGAEDPKVNILDDNDLAIYRVTRLLVDTSEKAKQEHKDMQELFSILKENNFSKRLKEDIELERLNPKPNMENIKDE